MSLNKKQKQIIWSSLLLIIVVGVLVFFARLEKKSFPYIGMFERFKPKGYTGTGERIPDEVHAYNGEVVEVSDGHLFVKVSSNENYVARDTILKVMIDEHTSFFAYQIPKTLEEDEIAFRAEEQIIRRDDVTFGSNVIVYSRSNVRGETKFLADKIVVLP